LVVAAAKTEWTGFPPDKERFRAKGLLVDCHDRELLAQLDWLPGKTCAILLRTAVRGPFCCNAEGFVHLLTLAGTVTPGAQVIPNHRNIVVIQSSARHSPVEHRLQEIVRDVFADLKLVLDSDGVQTLIGLSDSDSNGLDIQPWNKMSASSTDS